MLRFERARKARSDTNCVGLRHHDICYSPRVLGAHSGYDEIDTRSSDLALADGNLGNFDLSQISGPSPRGEFCVDCEGNEYTHLLTSILCNPGAGRYKF
jgi:hypothetical protein